MIVAGGRLESALNNTHVLGLTLTFPVSFVTFLVALWPTDFRGSLEMGGYVAMAGMALVLLVHMAESYDQPPALFKSWFVSSLSYTALAMATVMLWGIGFRGFRFGLLYAAATGAVAIMVAWQRYAAMTGRNRPPNTAV